MKHGTNHDTTQSTVYHIKRGLNLTFYGYNPSLIRHQNESQTERTFKPHSHDTNHTKSNGSYATSIVSIPYNTAANTRNFAIPWITQFRNHVFATKRTFPYL
eukprot:1101426_1